MDKNRPQDNQQRQEGQAGGLLETLGRMFAERTPQPPAEPRQVKETIDRFSSAPDAMPEPAPKVPTRRQYEPFMVILAGTVPAVVEAGASPDYWLIYPAGEDEFTVDTGVLIRPSDQPQPDTYVNLPTGATGVYPNYAQILTGTRTLKIPGRGRYLTLTLSGVAAGKVQVVACTNVQADRY